MAKKKSKKTAKKSSKKKATKKKATKKKAGKKKATKKKATKKKAARAGKKKAAGKAAAEAPPAPQDATLRETDARRVKEPEGGPRGRLEAFIAERFATPRPKDEEGLPAAEMAGVEIPRPAVSPDHRKQVIREYRRRQRSKAGESTESAEEGGGGDQDPALAGAPPQPFQPPPGNNWIPLGPSVVRKGQVSNQTAVSGRVAGVAVASGGNRVYVASANGGVWRSDDGGDTWRSTMEAWDLDPTTLASDSLACGAIAISPTDADRIYVGTGEGDTVFVIGGSVLGTGAFFGVGPIRSDDGGVNWTTEVSTPDLAGASFYALAVDPGDPDRVVAATTNGLYRRESDGSGGFQWVQKRTGVFSSVVAARSGGTTWFYAAQYSGSVWRSQDGHTWTSTTSGFPTSNVGRIGLAVQPTDPTVVYALIDRADNSFIRGVWRLDSATASGGGTWRQVSGHPADLFGSSSFASFGQGWYDLVIAIDPGNVNRIYLGGSTRSSGASGADQWSGCLYRSTVASSGSGSSLSYSMSNTAIGGNVHADVHTLAFTPGTTDDLWVGCDGGLFFTDDADGTADFEHRNTGLNTVTTEHLGLHPDQGAVVFVGTQDNGTVRYTGEEAWLHMAPGDGGFAVVNWNDPYKVLVTYPATIVRRFTDGGSRYNYTNVILSTTDRALFYSPLVGTPPNPAAPAEAERVAIGTTRPWISDTFGGGWSSIPAGTSSDQLGTTNGFRIKSMAFASHTRLYVGTMNGRVYRYDESGSGWSRTRIDNLGGTATLPSTFALPVTDIAVDPADASGSSIYITFGGAAGDYRRIWHWDGSQWQQRSGPSAGHVNSILDVQFNAVVVDPDATSSVYAAADIGCWHSVDGGGNWEPFSEGLPDASVFDLKVVRLGSGLRLLRASTHGRGVWERTLDSGAKAGVELYVRDTQLDEGRFTTVNGLPDPTDQGETVRHWRGPDIKLDTPDAMGQYQFPLSGTIDFYEFNDVLSDDARNVATHASETIITRVYVQVHNRGVTPADNVRVMCLLANASAGLPALPAGYDVNVRNGTPISTSDWETLGIADIDDVRVGHPKIAAFDLPSSLLPPPASLTGNDHHCVLALVHHADDEYTSTLTHTDNNSKQERKAAHKNLKVVQFTGTLPAVRVIPIRMNNPLREEPFLTRLEILLGRYDGRVRLYLPKLEVDGQLGRLIKGWKRGEDFEDFKLWAEEHIAFVRRNQEGQHPYHRGWAKQRIVDIEAALESGIMLEATGEEKTAVVRKIVLPPGEYATVFLLVDRPREAKVGEYFDLEARQFDDKEGELLGGLSTRIELVPEVERYRLKVIASDWRNRYTLLRAHLGDDEDRRISERMGASMTLESIPADRPLREMGRMRWHDGWKCFYAFVPKVGRQRLQVTASVRGVVVARESVVVRA